MLTRSKRWSSGVSSEHKSVLRMVVDCSQINLSVKFDWKKKKKEMAIVSSTLSSDEWWREHIASKRIRSEMCTHSSTVTRKHNLKYVPVSIGCSILKNMFHE